MYPDAFLERMKTLLGAEFPDFLESQNEEPCRGLRLNPLKADEAAFLSQSPFSLSPVPWAEHGFYYANSDLPGKHPYHEAGVYYIQEPSAMAAAPLLAPAPGEKILDLCAAPGGKSTQIGGALRGKGLLVSNEIHPARAKILSSNIERLGITNSLVTNETPARLAEFFPAFFDKILIDAPCSGEGMFRKNEAAISQWSPETVAFCAARQDETLAEAARMLKPGGRLVYSTCTFAPEENEGTIERFLSGHSDFTLLEKKRLYPHKIRGEGHFTGVLEKQGGPENAASAIPAKKASRKAKKDPARGGVLNHAPAEFSDFLADTFSESGIQFFADVLQKEAAGFFLFGEQLYLLPKGLPSLDGLKILRPGLHLGAIKKNRFEPSHGLALILAENQVKRSVCFSPESREIRAYLEGQSFCIPDDAPSSLSGQKGWCLVLVNHYSLGWSKLSGGLLKNHYPKGLRKQNDASNPPSYTEWPDGSA